MPWHFVALFFGGAFAANAIPHLVSGVSGRPLQTPFASPPFRGLSSPGVNVGWGLFNIAGAYVLLVHVGGLDVRDWLKAAICFAGFAAMALNSARSFQRIRREQASGPPSTPAENP